MLARHRKNQYSIRIFQILLYRTSLVKSLSNNTECFQAKNGRDTFRPKNGLHIVVNFFLESAYLTDSYKETSVN